MITSVVLLCIAVACAGAWLWWLGRRARTLFKDLPSYPQIPIIGHLHKCYGGGEALFRLFDELSRISDEKNLPFALWIGPCPAIIFMDPEDLKLMTNTFVEKPYYYNFARVWLGNGLVTAPISASIWRRSVKKLGGAFPTSIVDGYQDVFDTQARRLVTKMRAKVGGPPFDLTHDLAYTTLEAICQTALGVSGVSESIVTDEYYSAFSETLQLLLDRGLNLLLHSDTIYKLTPAYRKMRKNVAVLQNVSKTILTKRKAEWNEKRGCNGNEETNSPSRAKFKSYLDIILEMSSTEPTFTEEQIQAEVDTIIVGGQETMAANLLFVFLLLGCHEEVQEKLHAEFQEIFGDSDRPVEKEDLIRMRYCEAVVQETLRLYPSVPIVMRYADKDLQLKSCLVPKGAACGVNMLGAGRSVRAWGSDARQFRPERWLQPSLDNTHFIAFSVGKRACIGKKYAMALAKTVIANCVRSFRFTSNAANMTLSIDLGLRPASGNLLQVHARNPVDKIKM